jgi:lipopolysaccharide transport system permease protein
MATVLRSATQTLTWGERLAPWQIVTHLLRHRQLIRQFIVRDILGRYRGSYLGVFWAMLRPLCMLTVFSIVFGYIFEARLSSDPHETKADFAMALFCGLIVFEFFAECFGRAPSLITSNANYVTKVVFPLEVLPVTVVGAALAHVALSLIPLCLAYLLWHGALHVTALFIPVLLVPIILFCLGVTWLFAGLGVFIRDINSFMPVLIMIIMYASAIFYPLSRVPPQFRPLVGANPVAAIIDQVRNAFMWGQPPDWGTVGIMTVACAVVAVLGYAFFMSTRRAFADVI